MNSEKAIKNYIGGAKWVKVLAWVSFVIMIVSIFMGTALRKSDDKSTAEKFDPFTTTKGSYVYLDVAGISDWVMEYTNNNVDTTYYIAEDSEGYWYTLILDSTSVEEEMDEQREYWDRESDDVQQPEPYRIYGKAAKITDSVAEDMASQMSLSSDEYYYYMGELLLNGKASPADDWNTLWLVAEILSGVLWLSFALANSIINKRAKKAIQKLKELGELEQATAEFNAEGYVSFGADGGRATEHYLFGKESGSVLRYEDIVWCYQTVMNNAYTHRNCLTAYTTDKKAVNALSLELAYYDDIQKAMQIISEHNPNVLLGNTKENRQKYREYKKAAK